MNLFSSLGGFFDKISDRLPKESLTRISDKLQKFHHSLGSFDSGREEEFKAKLRLRFKPQTNQRSSQKNSQRLRDQLQSITEVEDEAGYMKVSARLLESVDRNYHH